MIRPPVSYGRVAATLALLAMPLALLPEPSRATTQPDATLRQRFDRLAHDPLLTDAQREFFSKRALGAIQQNANNFDAQAGPPLLSGVQTGLPVWSQYVAAPQQAGHVAVYDASTDKVLIVGGQNPAGLTTDVWSLSMSPPRAWTRIGTGGPLPSPRMGMSVVLDTRRHRLVMFGGIDANGSYLDDVWVMPLDGPSAWQHIDAGPQDPGARTNHSAVYDSLSERMVLFGGSDGGFDPLGDTWSLLLGDSIRWSPLVATGTPPPGRASHIAVINVDRRQMFVCAGNTGSTSENYAYVWTLALTGTPSWSQSAAFPYYSAPYGSGFYGAYDPVNNGIIAFRPAYGPLYEFTLGLNQNWIQYSLPTQPFDINAGCGFVLDPTRSRVVVVGGAAGYNPDFRGDAWALPLAGFGNWSQLFGLPAPRAYHSAAIDPVRRRMLVYGGYAQPPGNLTSEILALSLTSPPLWSGVQPLGTAPAPRQQAAMIYDPTGDRLILFGGTNGSQYTNEVWQLSLSGVTTWTRVRPAGTLPRERANSMAAYDPVGKRMIVFGGSNSTSSTGTNDLWSLSLTGPAAWTLLSPSGAPPTARVGAAMIYDDVANRMLLVGGYDNTYSYNHNSGSEIWAVDLSQYPAWNRLATSELGTSFDQQCAAIFEPVGHRVLRFGKVAGNYYNVPDTLRISSYTPGVDTLWSDLVVGGERPPGVIGGSIVYDPEQHRVLAFAGSKSGYNNYTAQTWGLSLGTLPLAAPNPAFPVVNGVALSAVPNPARSGLRLRITTAAAGDVRVSLTDLTGRMVFARDLGVLAAGQHDVAVAPATALPPGVYFATCRSRGVRVDARVVVVR